MKKLMAVCVSVLLILGSVSGFAQESVQEIKNARSDGYVRINVLRGEISVEGWDKNEVSVIGTLDESMEEFIFEVKDKETVIAVKLPQRNNNWCCPRETDLVIKVPKNSNVAVSLVSTAASVNNIHGGLELGGVSGELKIENVSDRVRITNISGEVTLREADGRVRVKTISGDVNASEIKGPGVFSSVSGSIDVSHSNDDLDLESVSGDIEVTDSLVRAIRANSVSGDVEIDAEMTEGASIECGTMSGDLRLMLGGKIDARFDVETGSGRIRNRVTPDKAKKSKYVRDETLRFTVGNGKGEVIASSGSGNITLN
ncbi:MAG: DUF4097 and DUF4098 domain-containing protein YvlB [Patiriisocius sp.]|jgi:DUF4097 and DUF4098 domain-containing protein YvlB